MHMAYSAARPCNSTRAERTSEFCKGGGESEAEFFSSSHALVWRQAPLGGPLQGWPRKTLADTKTQKEAYLARGFMPYFIFSS